MKLKTYFIALIALLGITLQTNAATSFSHSTPAVQGYDVVSYQTSKRPVRGNGHFIAVHNGATYQFSSEQNRDVFQQDPDKYAPAYNGYCAFGASVGKKFIGDPEVWRLVNGKLYLNLDTNVQAQWLKDVPGRIKTADEKWEEIKDKDPALL